MSDLKAYARAYTNFVKLRSQESITILHVIAVPVIVTLIVSCWCSIWSVALLDAVVLLCALLLRWRFRRRIFCLDLIANMLNNQETHSSSSLITSARDLDVGLKLSNTLIKETNELIRKYEEVHDINSP